ncbi:uncharacterized protein LOC128211948 isoform X3 [Mya arenaria]|uniref:uncharacterized protein LOC128211948 isoform X2 n=1 Tax=Mya arenaria TaxID=6604 RepID=UPI0022E0D3C6|nr:uncharacterized protein LOC128211948 isoform X2 [Mya arenaria]XP_052773068.1 uncharacterized protein LOC128211948 isoform X3 [Mya arenaria]
MKADRAMILTSHVIVTLWLVPSLVRGQAGGQYYNDKYGTDDIDYKTDDNMHGLYDQTFNYLHDVNFNGDVSIGCSYDKKEGVVVSCSSSSVTLANLPISSIAAGTFSNTTTSILIYNCGSFELFEDGTFENLTSLNTLIVQGTSLNHLPDLSQTAVNTVNLAGNKIVITTENHRGWTFPTSIQRLTLAQNRIHWLPKNIVSGPQLTLASFSHNWLPQIHPNIFGDTSALRYLGMDGNRITRISKNSLDPLATNQFLHLNLSNNALSFIQPNTFSNLPAIKIIEMHQNSMATITWNVFSDMPNLIHLDLHANDFVSLGSKSFVNLPSLKELRLHSQKTGLATIAYDAFQNINDNLQELFVSSNALTTYPHQVLEEDHYPNLVKMHADNNLISNLTEFGTEAFPTNQYFLHAQRFAAFTPFSATPNIVIMYLQNNLITTINTTDLCELQALEELYLSDNKIRESLMDVDCFACLPVLNSLQLPGNLIQYVPAALQSSEVVPALITLNIRRNKITFLQTGAFSNVSTLLTLYMANNLILTVENGAFPTQIRLIEMRSNEFRFLHEDPFRYLDDLATLDLSSNQIQYLPDNAFEGCTSLTTLFLNNNNIAVLKKVHFENCPLTNDVTFASNDIGWIEEGTFENVSSMNSLDLSNNVLTRIPGGGTFWDLQIGKDLDLSNNRINLLTNQTFKSFRCVTLSLSNNKITEIHGYAFDDVSVSSLTLSGNPLRKLYSYALNSVHVTNSITMSGLFFDTIPTMAFYDVTASSLDLNSGEVATIEESAFYDLNVVTLLLNGNALHTVPNTIFGGACAVTDDLRLDGNNMSLIDTYALNNSVINDLYLNDNIFMAVPRVITQQSFDELYLQNNLIEEIPTGFFDLQTSLRILDLSNNLLTALEPGVFDSLVALNTLTMSSNKLATLPSTLLDSMTGLQYLYMSSNEMTHIYSLGNKPLLVVDFSSNNVGTIAGSAFSNLGSLGTLNLGGNPLECSCQLVMTLEDVAGPLTSATCDQNANANGVVFPESMETSTMYYKNVETSSFTCSGDNVAVSAVSGTGFTIEWDQPGFTYYQTNGSLTSPMLSGEITYHVECISSYASTVLGSRTDTNATDGPTAFSLGFDASDGVEAGTPYECSIKMELNNSDVSAKSEPAVFVTPDSVTPDVAGPNDVELQVKYYDFSKAHEDFDNLDYVTVSDVSYVDSPYGAWLAASTSPTSDTFSTWFRSDSENQEVDGIIVLFDQGGNTKQYYSDSYFPVDGEGFGSENQLDCNNKYHNFGFTAAVRVGLVYGGSEIITVAGGDAMWLYINKVRMFEFVSDGTTSPCFVVDLSSADLSVGEVYLETGTFSGGACSGLTSSTTPISLALEVGVTYHFDLFLVESKRCSSELLLRTENVVFSQDKTTDLPVDYMVAVPEDENIREILAADVNLVDIFSSPGSFSISLYKGNEARRFSIEESTYTFTAPAPTVPAYTNVTDIYGNHLQYVECNAASTLVTMPNDPTAETFTIGTTSLYVTLIAELDHEVENVYKLLLSVTDTALTLTGYIGVRIQIVDVNDNCPIITPTEFSATPQPVLQVAPLTTFTVSDADSGENSNIHYVVSSVFEDQAVMWDDTYDLWGDVYLQYTSLIFDVIAMDNGTVPFGMTASMNVTVSNTCVLDVLFGKIEYWFLVNDTTGEMTLRVPKYWMYEFLCSDALGLSTGTVLDFMMSSSSAFHAIGTGVGRARLNQLENVYSELAGAWVAGTVDADQWVAVDMGVPYKFTAVQIQGRSDADEWVTSFRIQYYANGTWHTYKDVNNVEVFAGNSDRTTVVTHALDPAVLSNKIRVNPVTWNAGNISMRLEFNGCAQAEQLFYDVSCMRCETTYYCEGEGVQKPCGRCLDNGTCDRNPVEHSFGLTDTCTTCPLGWICKDGYATPCDDFHYVECTNTSCPASCTHCEPGYACNGGVRSICEPGSYSDGNMEECAPCDSGTYQDQSGQSSCISCSEGYYSAKRKSECARCAPEEYSTGSECIGCSGPTECPCLNAGGSPCYDYFYCYNKGGGGYGCAPCEAGLTGDGTTCVDTDECTVHQPCFMDRCINTEPGYQCLECPLGYTGTFEDAYAWDVHQRVFVYRNLERSNFTIQTCDDIDECATGNGGCDPLMTCINTAGSYYCSFCADGYMGTNKSGCYLDNFCISGAHNCIAEANCIYLGPAQYRCVCKPGYAGPGDFCGLDSDNDGFPDTGIPCQEWGCRRDNCRSIPSSMQEDTDGDNTGDNCDKDDDNDGRYDWLDNCQYVSNWDQADADGDGFGDACDVCPNDVDPDQLDTDEDGTGDVCDSDDDNDGVLDVSDNCPLVANAANGDADGDGIGDACDNCPNVNNADQADTNENFYGDACETVGANNIDEDGDSIPDSFDNCPSYMNGDQSDIDGDSIGDLCDDDADGDGVNNDVDNCPYFSNADQTDVDGNNVGDVCEADSDGDGVDDKNDTCPFNPAISETSFKSYFTVNFDPTLTTSPPKWLVKNNGGEVMQKAGDASMPMALIGKQSYGGIEYQGTWFTTQTSADEYFGFVFGYQSNRKFYVAMWKARHYNYLEEDESTYKGGLQGVQIKRFDSSVGPGSQLAEALWHSYDTAGIATMLWQDPQLQEWQPNTSYRWYLTHAPTTGYINIKVYQGTSLLVDSGDLYDSAITAGRVGVLQFGEFPVTWSNLRVNCLGHTNQALYFDGVDDNVMLDDAVALGLEYSFTLEVWLSLDTGYTTGPYPVMCTTDAFICLSIDAGAVVGRYGNYSVSSSTTLSADKWYNVIFRHRIESEDLSIFIDSVKRGTLTDVVNYNLTEISTTSDLTMYIGKGGDNFFRGTLDEVRIYNEGIQDDEISAHIALVSLERPVIKAYGSLYFRMEDSVDAASLSNSGRLAPHTATREGGIFTSSYQQFPQFQVAHPNNK